MWKAAGPSADLLPLLKQALCAGVGSGGVPVGAAESFVVIILHIPMVREAGGEVHRTAHALVSGLEDEIPEVPNVADLRELLAPLDPKRNSPTTTRSDQ